MTDLTLRPSQGGFLGSPLVCKVLSSAPGSLVGKQTLSTTGSSYEFAAAATFSAAHRGLSFQSRSGGAPRDGGALLLAATLVALVLVAVSPLKVNAMLIREGWTGYFGMAREVRRLQFWRPY